MDNLKVCIITEAAEGGVARQLMLLSTLLPQLGIIPSFILSLSRPGSAGLADKLRQDGLSVQTCRMGRNPNPFTDWAAYGCLRLQLRRFAPDIVHTHCFKAGLLGRRAAHDEGLECVHTPHVFPFEWMRGISGMVATRLERMAAKWSERIIALSEYQVEMALRRKVAGVDKFEVIANGVDTNYFSPVADDEKYCTREIFGLPAEAFVVGSVLREGRQKNFSGLIEGLETVLRQNPQIYVLLAGEVPSAAEQLKLRGDWGGRLIFCGMQDDMRCFYHALDCYVLCSLWEGLPYSLLEAMSCALPVIASATGGAIALINDNEDGLLFSSDNSPEMAGIICSLAGDEEKRRYLGSWARAKVEQFYSVDDWVQRLAGVYRDVAGVGFAVDV